MYVMSMITALPPYGRRRLHDKAGADADCRQHPVRCFCLQTGMHYGNVALPESELMNMAQSTYINIISIAIISITGISPGG